MAKPTAHKLAPRIQSTKTAEPVRHFLGEEVEVEQKNLAELGDVIAELSSSLSPVLMPLMAQGTNLADEGEIFESPVTRSIRENNIHLVSLITQLRELRARVAL